MKLSAITIQIMSHHWELIGYETSKNYAIGKLLHFAQEKFLIIRNARGLLTSVGEEYASLSPWVTVSGLPVLLL